MTTPHDAQEPTNLIATRTAKHGVITVDACDRDMLIGAYSHKATSTHTYAQREISGRKSYLHREILERIIERKLLTGECVDHINGNGLDNRRENIRIANKSQNNANRRLSKRNTSGYKGVSWGRTNKKWMASIRHNGQTYSLGGFDDPAEAHEAYMTAARAYFGEFANDGKGGLSKNG